MTKAGFLGSARFGSGVLIARLPDEHEPEQGREHGHGPNCSEDGAATAAAAAATFGGGRWSHPSAIGIFGGGFGGQVGFELTDFVFIFNSTSSLSTFSKSGSLTVSGNLSIAFGPVGRSAEITGGVSSAGAGKMMSFAKTKGLFGGVSLESGVLVERRGANKRFYGKTVKTGDILGGRVVLENAERDGDGVRELMRALGEVFNASSARAGEGERSVPATTAAELPAAEIPAVEVPAVEVPAAELPAEEPAAPAAGPQLESASIQQNTADADEAVERGVQVQEHQGQSVPASG